jgi:hypothetical protein
VDEKGGWKPGSQRPTKATTSQSTWPATWRRVLARRRAAKELDLILGTRRYPAPPTFVVVWADRHGEVAA